MMLPLEMHSNSEDYLAADNCPMISSQQHQIFLWLQVDTRLKKPDFQWDWNQVRRICVHQLYLLSHILFHISRVQLGGGGCS